VIVAALEPLLAVIEVGDAATRDCAALGGPTVPVAVNVTGLPVRPAAVAVSVFVPGVVASVHDVAAAIPSTPVVTGVVGVTDPLPAAAAKITATPDTGLPLASFTITEGGGVTAVPAGADTPPAFRAIDAAPPALSAIAPELTGVIPVPPPKLSV
jgi:hypothetical protein